jgi:hypothetical protein
MDKIYLGWVIGMIDGEGSILLTKSSGRRNPRIMLPSTDLETLQALKDFAGGYICKRGDKRLHTFQAWTWVLSGKAALELLRQSVFYLRVPQKRARAEYLLEFWKPKMSADIRLKVENGFFDIPDNRRRRDNL